MPAADSVVVAAVVAARESPATPRTDNAFFDRFLFTDCFICDIKPLLDGL